MQDRYVQMAIDAHARLARAAGDRAAKSPPDSVWGDWGRTERVYGDVFRDAALEVQMVMEDDEPDSASYQLWDAAKDIVDDAVPPPIPPLILALSDRYLLDPRIPDLSVLVTIRDEIVGDEHMPWSFDRSTLVEQTSEGWVHEGPSGDLFFPARAGGDRAERLRALTTLCSQLWPDDVPTDHIEWMEATRVLAIIYDDAPPE